MTTLAVLKGFFSSLPNFIAGIGMSLLAFVAPVQHVIWGVFFIILLDTYFGILVSKKLKEKNKHGHMYSGYVQSRKWWKGIVPKMLESAALILCGHVIDVAIVPSISLRLVEVFAGIIAGGEIISILENLIELHPDRTWLKIINKVIRAKGEKYLDITIDVDDFKKVKDAVDKKIK